MSGVKVMAMASIWLTSVISLGAIEFVPIVAQSSGVDMDGPIGKALSTGTPQAVLAAVVVGLSLALVWMSKKLLAVQDLRVEEQKEHNQTTRDDWDKTLSETKEVMQQTITSNQSVAKASHRLADTSDRVALIIEKCTKTNDLSHP